MHPNPTSQTTDSPGSGPLVLILGASFDTSNLGVSALAASAVSAVRNAIPEARVHLLDYGREPRSYQITHARGTAPVELINLRFSWKVFLPNNVARLLATAVLLRCVPFRSVRQRSIRRNVYLRRVQAAMVAGSLAGGDSFSDIYGLRRLFYVALPQLLVLALGRPLVLLPQTIGPFRSRIAKWLGAFVMQRAGAIYARDEEGVFAARAMLTDDPFKVAFAYDLAFQLPSTKPAPTAIPGWWSERPEGQPLVGVNVSGLLYRGGYSRDNMFGLKTEYRALVLAVVEHLVQRRGARVMLFPHVYGPENDVESDDAACAAVLTDLKSRCGDRLHRLEGRFDQHEIKYLIGRCDFVVGSRMHACIAALSQDVPAVGLAYSDKFAGVLRSIGMERLVVDLRTCEPAEVLRSVDEAFLARKGTRADLAACMPRVRRAASECFASCLPTIAADDHATGRRASEGITAWSAVAGRP